MRRLIAFGDSWTMGHGVETNACYKEIGAPDDLTAILRICNSWPRWLAQELNLQFVNLGFCGISNEQILWRIQNERPRFLPDDLIIVMWSYPYRRPNVSSVAASTPVRVLREANQLLQGYDYHFVNAFFPYFQEEPHNTHLVDITRFLAVESCAADYLSAYERCHDVGVWEYQNRNLLDHRGIDQGFYHPNLLGYRLIARWISSLLHGQMVPMEAIEIK